MAIQKSRNQIFGAYLVVTLLSFLVMPESLGLHVSLGVSPESIPIYSWISNVQGVDPTYPDFFLLSWILLPFWVFAFGVIYVLDPPVIRPPASKVLLACLASIATILVILLSDMDVSDSTGRASRLIAAAARVHWFGAVVFAGLFSFLFSMLAIVFVVTPLRLVRLDD